MSRARALHIANGVPDAGQPVGDEREGAHEQEEDGRAVFRVAVQLPRHAYQTQQPCRLQQANQSGGLRLGEEFQAGYLNKTTTIIYITAYFKKYN